MLAPHAAHRRFSLVLRRGFGRRAKGFHGEIMSQQSITTYQVNAEAVTWQVVDDEAVVIHADTSEYFSLNLSGTFLWNLMVEHACGEDELAEGISNRYEQGTADARAHVSSFMGKLQEALLIEQSEGQTPGATAGITSRPPTDAYEPPDLVKFGDLETLILSGE